MPNTTLLRAMKVITKDYLKAEVAQQKRMLRHIIDLSLGLTTQSIINGVKVHNPFSFNFSEGKNAGFIMLHPELISRRLKEVINEHNEEFVKEVFSLSQEYVPIDKRFAEAKRYKFLDTGRKSIKSEIYAFDNTDETKKYSKFFNLGYTIRTNQRTEEGEYSPLLSRGEPERVAFERKSGWYEESEYNYIKDMLRGGSHRTRYNRYYYDMSSKNPEDYTIRVRKKYGYGTRDTIDTGMKLKNDPLKSLRGVKHTFTQPSGGYQELKKGGQITHEADNQYGIVYSAYDKSRKNSTFNYAALQHENLAFKHKYGQARFLYRAYSQTRRKWYESAGLVKLKEKITDAFK